MLTLKSKIDSAPTIYGELVLPYALREKSRQRAVLRSGEEVALFTVRGTVLRHGDLLQGYATDTSEMVEEKKHTEIDQSALLPIDRIVRVIRIVAANEETYRVACETQSDLLRCAFHLGNRHTQAQVGSDMAGSFLRIRRDPVLKEMLIGLGASVREESAPFEPESGAYGGPGGGHHHGAEHSNNLLAPVPLRQKIHRPGDVDG